MKRGLIFTLLLIFVILITSCNRTVIEKIDPPVNSNIVDENKQQAPPSSIVSEDGIKGVSLLYNKDLDINYFKNLGLNTAFLSVNGVRIAKSPYRTDFNVLRNSEKAIDKIKNENINYVINITSGPGYSGDGNITSIFDNRQEALYYANMVKETIGRQLDNPNFKGISLSFENPNIPEKKYYETLSYITSKIREEYPDVNLIVSLHPLSFETGMKNVSTLDFNNVTLNVNISLRTIDYPGSSLGYKSSFKINRNSILSNLQILKDDFAEKNTKVIVTIRSPWSDKSDVFLQDIFEIIRMLDFNFTLDYGNSQDVNDFKNTDSVIKIIKRHSK